MPVNSANQGIPEQQGTDLANLPSAQASWDGVIENRLLQRFTNTADRTGRNPTPNENEVSAVAAEDRVEIFDSANWISLFSRSMYANTRVPVGADQTLAASSTTLQNVNSMVATLPASGTFAWRAVVFADASTTSDIKFAYNIPAGATMLWGPSGGAPSVAAGVGDGVWGPCQSGSDAALAFGTSGVGTANTQMYIHEGEITMGGTAGDLRMRAAQNVSDATAIVIRARSRFMVWRVL